MASLRSGSNIVPIFLALAAGIVFAAIALYVPNSNLGYRELPPPKIDLSIVGLKPVYRVGSIIDFHIKYKESGGCDSPKLDVIKLQAGNSPITTTTIQSNQILILCAASTQGLGLDGDWHVGSNAFPPYDRPIIINETGSYEIKVSMRDKVQTSEPFDVVAS